MGFERGIATRTDRSDIIPLKEEVKSKSIHTKFRENPCNGKI
jgi:hypothetical protein